MTSRTDNNNGKKKDGFDKVGKCSCGQPILRWMLKYSSTMCASCDSMWRNEARFMQQ